MINFCLFLPVCHPSTPVLLCPVSLVWFSRVFVFARHFLMCQLRIRLFYVVCPPPETPPDCSRQSLVKTPPSLTQRRSLGEAPPLLDEAESCRRNEAESATRHFSPSSSVQMQFHAVFWLALQHISLNVNVLYLEVVYLVLLHISVLNSPLWCLVSTFLSKYTLSAPNFGLLEVAPMSLCKYGRFGSRGWHRSHRLHRNL